MARDTRTLTPMRALDLLRTADKARGSSELSDKNWALKHLADALDGHIRAALAKKRRRVRRRKP